MRIANPPALLTTVLLQVSIASQLNISFEQSVLFVRLQKVRVYGALSTGLLQQTNVIIYDPLQAAAPSSVIGTSRILEQYIDFPDQVNRARIGYIYPKAQREVSLTLANTNGTALLFSSNLGNTAVVYFDIQWRTFNSSVAIVDEPSLQDLELEESLDRAADQYARETLIRDRNGIITTLAASYFNRK